MTAVDPPSPQFQRQLQLSLPPTAHDTSGLMADTSATTSTPPALTLGANTTTIGRGSIIGLAVAFGVFGMLIAGLFIRRWFLAQRTEMDGGPPRIGVGWADIFAALRGHKAAQDPRVVDIERVGDFLGRHGGLNGEESTMPREPDDIWTGGRRRGEEDPNPPPPYEEAPRYEEVVTEAEEREQAQPATN